MKRTKTILLLISLLVIGFVGGYLIHQKLVQKHLMQIAVERVNHAQSETKKARTQVQEAQELRNYFNAKDDLFTKTGIEGEQRSHIEAILEEYERGVKHLQAHFRAQRNMLVDSLHQKLISIELTEEQKDQLFPLLHQRFLKATPF